MPTEFGKSAVTIDHEFIKRWAQEREGKPSQVVGTEKGGTGMLRIRFPSFGSDANLKEITWEEFFEKFDEKKLAFLYQEKMKNGQISRFFKFVSRK